MRGDIVRAVDAFEGAKRPNVIDAALGIRLERSQAVDCRDGALRWIEPLSAAAARRT
ncbi:hypothetical protein BC2230_60474 [Burkholderia cepacia]